MRIFLVLLALLTVSRAFAQREEIFGYRDVVGKAEALSKQPFAAQIQDISPDLQNLDYDLYRRIRFLPEKSVWKTLPYRLGFFHPGYYFKRRVIFHNIEKDRVRDFRRSAAPRRLLLASAPLLCHLSPGRAGGGALVGDPSA